MHWESIGKFFLNSKAIFLTFHVIMMMCFGYDRLLCLTVHPLHSSSPLSLRQHPTLHSLPSPPKRFPITAEHIFLRLCPLNRPWVSLFTDQYWIQSSYLIELYSGTLLFIAKLIRTVKCFPFSPVLPGHSHQEHMRYSALPHSFRSLCVSVRE